VSRKSSALLVVAVANATLRANAGLRFPLRPMAKAVHNIYTYTHIDIGMYTCTEFAVCGNAKFTS
jgi:hypothetical protein